MPVSADRYYVKPLNKIYPGSLKGLTDACDDAQKLSEAKPDITVKLFARGGNESRLVRVLRDGELLIMEDDDGDGVG